MWRCPRVRLLPLRSQRRCWTTLTSSGAPTSAQYVGSPSRQPAHVACVPPTPRLPPVQQHVRQLHVDDVDEVPMLHDRVAKVERLKQIVTSNSPRTLSKADHDELLRTLHHVLDGPALKRFLYATLHCCPFYAAAKANAPPEERYARNKLCIVYASNDDTFFGQFRSKFERLPRLYVLDDWLHVYDLSEFYEAFVEGTTFPVESLAASPDCVLYSHPDFTKVRESVKDPRAFYHVAFHHTAAAKVMNQAFERGWSKGSFKKREESTFEALCAARRLKMLMDRNLSALEAPTSWPDLTTNGSEEEVAVLEKLKTDTGATELEYELEDWYEWISLILNVEKRGYFVPYYLRKTFYLLAANYYCCNIAVTSRVDDDEAGIETAANLMKRFQQPVEGLDRWQNRGGPDGRRSRHGQGQGRGGKGRLDVSPFASISGKDILCFTLSGSKLYNLELPTSDEDYCCIFRYPNLTRIVHKLQRQSVDVIDFRATGGRMGDPNLSAIAAWETRKLLTMLLKGSVEWYQVLYHEEELLYEHPLFKELRENKDRIMSELVIDNFRKYIKAFLRQLDEVNASLPAHKCLYQVFHKLDQVESLIRGEAPRVICTGERRDLIMKIRRGEMESQHNDLKEDAWQRLRATSVYREEHGPAWRAVSDREFLVDWLYRVYGLKFTDAHFSGSAFDVEIDGVKHLPDPKDLESLAREGQDWHALSDGVVNP